MLVHKHVWWFMSSCDWIGAYQWILQGADALREFIHILPLRLGKMMAPPATKTQLLKQSADLNFYLFEIARIRLGGWWADARGEG